MDCCRPKRAKRSKAEKLPVIVPDSVSVYSVTPSPPPAGCWGRLTRRPSRSREPSRQMKKVASDLSSFSGISMISSCSELDVELPPLPLIKKPSYVDQLRRTTTSTNILAQLAAEEAIPGARALHRADLRVTARTTSTRGGMHWEVEDPTRTASPAPRRPTSRAASRAGFSEEGDKFLREQIAQKHAKSEQLRRQLEAERAERTRARRKRADESRERAKSIKAKKDPYREMEPDERAEYLQMIEQTRQPLINIPKIPGYMREYGNGMTWNQGQRKYMHM